MFVRILCTLVICRKLLILLLDHSKMVDRLQVVLKKKTYIHTDCTKHIINRLIECMILYIALISAYKR